METNENILTLEEVSKEIANLHSLVIQKLPKEIYNLSVLRYLIKNPDIVEKLLRELISVIISHLRDEYQEDLTPQIKSWKKFYKDNFSMDVDFSKVKIPERKEDFDQLIIIPKDLSLEQVIHKCEEKVGCWGEGSKTENQKIRDDRDSTEGHYAVWVRGVIEAEDLLGKSADKLRKEGIPGITFKERLLYGLKYSEENDGKQLDTEKTTLCSGSCSSEGEIPYVSWNGGSYYLGYCTSDTKGPSLSSRRVLQ